MSEFDNFNFHDNLPDFDKEIPSITKLLFKFRDAYRTAQGLNASRLEVLEEGGFHSIKRHVMDEPANEFVPVDTDRIVLKPEGEDRVIDGIARLILRFPQAGKLPIVHPNDVFVETVDFSERRRRFLANGRGLAEYWSILDLDDLEGDELAFNDLYVVEAPNTDRTEELYLLNDLMRVYIPTVQSGRELER